ncbi:hypothetical protein E3N88_34079 [Mikania micrantha]|uniref:Peptidase S10, serine carboxypeptidase, Alpha/Beta hydrolase fold protein n=1 Tax=Mikania micrantha TaxID=192012 RepID=A0A5N6MFR2_9ASTR|nr:hypothetical protein E3N88_34079 [Mikania micrantha]
MSLLLILLLAASSTVGFSQTIVETLPGFSGPLPFKLETGYIGVGENEAVQLFYYFVESERNPEEDPLIIWLAGGPGCSTIFAFIYEIGPLHFQYGSYIDGVPELQVDPNSWTQVANVIFLDAPTVTGYSYTNDSNFARASDTTSASNTLEFIRKFINNHPKFSNNPFYVTGISYSGTVVPIITEAIFKGNEDGVEPIINIKGYMLGNPLTDKKGDVNSRLEYAYRMGLVPKRLFETTRRHCYGDYADANPANLRCMSDIDEVNKRLADINILHILDPNCNQPTNFVKSGNPRGRTKWGFSDANPIQMVSAEYPVNDTACSVDNMKYADIWANDKTVMKALGVREGTVNEWTRCISNMSFRYGVNSLPLYEINVLSSVAYHRMLTKRNCRALVFSGDYDMLIPHSGTLNWINSLDLSVTDSDWEAWYSGSQIAGYKTTFARNNYTLVFATIKGAGHLPPEYKRAECFELAKRWFDETTI